MHLRCGMIPFFDMPEEVTFKQMDASEKNYVLAFLEKSYPDNSRQSDLAFWDWHFLAPPSIDADNLPVWLAKSGEQIVGQLGAIPVELNVEGKLKRAIWILDLIVDLEFRRKGIARRLVLEAERFCPLILGTNTTKQHSTELLQSMGFVIVTKIPRFQKLLFPGELVSVTPLRSALNIAFAPLRPSATKLESDTENIKLLDEFDASFDELWQETKGQWKCSVVRSSAMLDWQFCKQPGKKFEILGYFKDDKLLGYAILFFRKANAKGQISKAAISDICYHPNNARDIVDELIKASLKLAVERRAGGIVTDVIDPLVERRLRAFGFWRVNSGLQFLASAPEDQELVYDPHSWFLTRGDSDISIFEQRNL